MRWVLTGIVALTLVAAGGPVAGATLRLTELLINSPPGSTGGVLPDYLELHYSGFAAPPKFSVVVLNAAAGSNGFIEAVINLTASSANDTIVVHEDTWPAGSPYNGQRVAHPATLDLGTQFASSRRVLLLDQHVAWVANSNFGSGPNTWAASLTALEMIELSVNGGTLAAAPVGFGAIAHTLALSVNAGEALFRHVDGGSYTDAFSRGTPDASLALGDGQSLNPTFVNLMSPTGGDDDEETTPTHSPEPAAAATLATLLIALSAARRGRRGRRSTGHPASA